MEKLKMQTTDLAEENYKKLAALFPNAVTETINEDGEVVRAIDADVLRQEISTQVVEGKEERYQFTWPEKMKSVILSNQPITKTLRLDRNKSVGRDGTLGNINTENIYIEGNNLDALKLLQETYLGKIKMIYIDPPYNTGSDLIYEDDFSLDTSVYLAESGQFDEHGNRLVQNIEGNGRFHTDWLNMLYPRLRIAKDLLSNDGVLAISIGYQELTNLMKMCTEIFGNKQIMSIAVQTSGGKPNGGFSITNEFVVFVVPPDFEPIPTEEDMKSYSSPYHGMNLATFNQVQRPNQAYPIYVNSKGIIEGCGKSIQERIDDGTYSGMPGDFIYDYSEAPSDCVSVWPVTSKNEQCVWRLIPSRLMSDWKKGYIKVVPSNDNTNNKYGIQYLSGGIIAKIENGELETYKVSEDPEIPTVDVREYKTAGAGIATVWTDTQFYTTKGSNQIRDLFGEKCFSYPKPLELVQYILKRTVSGNDIVLDFFSGSSTTAHALMELNAQNNSNCKYIMVQIEEETDPQGLAYKAGYKTICDIGEERIRRAGKKIKKEIKANIDYGFRVFKVDESNMKDVYYNPGETQQPILDMFADNIKPDRTPEDLLFQVMLDLGVMLSSKIEETEIAGKKVFDVADGFLIACFDKDVTDETVKAIAQKKPYYAVFRDSSMANDSVATNFDQIFESYSPDTVRKVL